MSDAPTIAPPPAVDIKSFWTTLGQRATGITIVTASGEDGPTGFLGLSAAHVTADPPTMLVSVDRKTSALATILASRHFAVNFLPAGAEKVADAFGGKAGLTGADRFSDGDWTVLATGAPVFKNALGVFDCAVEDVIQRGDISIIIGAVKAVSTSFDAAPLIFFRGKMRSDFV
jgi:flavin reductase (DIM6/NTAB) family NADH-FMN oxidoreductase RutF